MTTIGITRGLSQNSEFMRQLEKAAADEVGEALDAVGRDAVARCDAIVAKTFVTDRDPSRRRNGRHLLGSFVAVVIEDDEFPVTLQISSLAESGKVNALNEGSIPHDIFGSPWLVFNVAEKRPRGKTTGGKSTSRGLNKARGKSAGKRRAIPSVRTDVVHHPGTQAYQFMQDALEGAVQAAYGQAVRLSRG